GPSRSARHSDPARRAAYDVLRAVSERDAYANLTLPGELTRRGLGGRDAAFATELCYGTLRHLGPLDAILGAAASRPIEQVDPPVRDALRLGAYQLLHTRVPQHAAVSTTVSLVRAEAGRGASGFGNAVLRRIAGRDWDAWVDALAPGDELGRLAFAHAHPEWIARGFADALGGDLTELAAALAADNVRPSVHLAALPGRIAAEQLIAETGGTPGAYSRYAVRLPGGAPGDLPAVVRRLATVQDEGSQLVALALSQAPLDGTDRRWLDLCAGPGGKAALLAAVAAERDASLTAVEVAAHRARLVESATRGLPVRVVHGDGREVGVHPELPEAGFDRVLVDAPCTGLGALRRRPEARWRRTPEDLATLTGLQRELLTAALRAVRPAGVVGYVTCSPHLAETAAGVERVRRECGIPTELLSAGEALSAVSRGSLALPDGPTAQLWPHRHGTDAMFLALLRRTG
ncbi:MAG: RsmB/NOP family class I SAM-dependent RNA methyltransferase, partial [Micromonosporaceae bacterium]